MEEVWKPVPGFEGFYEVSNLGRARSLSRLTRHWVGGFLKKNGRILKNGHDTHGYVQWIFSVHGSKRTIKAHTAVLEAFVCGRPDGLQACHNDGIRTNNRVENLRWDSALNNQADKVKHGRSGRGVKNCKAKLTEADVLSIRADSKSFKEIAEMFGVTETNVRFIKSRKTWAWLQ